MKKRIICLVLTVIMTASVMAGCGSTKSASADSGKKLNVFVWTEYVPDSVFKKFEDETGKSFLEECAVSIHDVSIESLSKSLISSLFCKFPVAPTM